MRLTLDKAKAMADEKTWLDAAKAEGHDLIKVTFTNVETGHWVRTYMEIERDEGAMKAFERVFPQLPEVLSHRPESLAVALFLQPRAAARKDEYDPYADRYIKAYYIHRLRGEELSQLKNSLCDEYVQGKFGLKTHNNAKAWEKARRAFNRAMDRRLKNAFWGLSYEQTEKNL